MKNATRKAVWTFALVLALFGVPSPLAAEVMLGQVQTFDDPHSWMIGLGEGGGTPQPVPVALGGPGGADDPFLSIVSAGGAGPGSRLSAQNFEEWTGNYLAAGVNTIRMDVRNFETTDLSVRLLFVEFAETGPVSAAFSTDAILVPGGSDWHTISFAVSPSALTPIPAPFLPVSDPLATLANNTELRIFHNPAPFFAPGMIPPVVGNLGVDNITAAATAVPEPATGGLLLAGILLARLVRPRARKTP